jgi:hypothetical protein
MTTCHHHSVYYVIACRGHVVCDVSARLDHVISAVYIATAALFVW